MSWRSLAARKAGERRDAKASEDLTVAYLEVFHSRNPNAEIVLADLADFCGFYAVPGADASAETLRYEQGLRAAFSRIFHFLTLPEEKLRGLEEAARAEALANEEEGIL
jgi:hypothetical protein